jgi:hypothetical protein
MASPDNSSQGCALNDMKRWQREHLDWCPVRSLAHLKLRLLTSR